MIKVGMKKILVILILLLCACDDDNLYEKSESGTRYWKDCIDGKEFIVGERRLSINLDFDGKPIRCEVEEE